MSENLEFEMKAIYQEQKANRIAMDEAHLNYLKEELCVLEDTIAETKEEIAEVVANWFSQNEIEPDVALTPVQKCLLASTLFFLKNEEEIISIKIEIAIAKIRGASRELRYIKGGTPTAHEKTQEDAEYAAERRFNEISQHAAMPQYIREDLYQSMEYQHDLVAFWNEQTDRCQRMIDVREREEARANIEMRYHYDEREEIKMERDIC